VAPFGLPTNKDNHLHHFQTHGVCGVDENMSNETRGTPLHSEGSKGETELRKVKEGIGEVKVQLHSFLSLPLQMSDQPNTPAALPPDNVPLVLIEQEMQRWFWPFWRKVISMPL
jgi:hypothetical protein